MQNLTKRLLFLIAIFSYSMNCMAFQDAKARVYAHASGEGKVYVVFKNNAKTPSGGTANHYTEYTPTSYYRDKDDKNAGTDENTDVLFFLYAKTTNDYNVFWRWEQDGSVISTTNNFEKYFTVGNEQNPTLEYHVYAVFVLLPTVITSSNVELEVGTDGQASYVLSAADGMTGDYYNFYNESNSITAVSGNTGIITVGDVTPSGRDDNNHNNQGTIALHPVSAGQTTLTITAKNIDGSEACSTTINVTVSSAATLELGPMSLSILSDDNVGTVSVTGSGLGDNVNVTVSGSDFQISADQTSWSSSVDFATSSSSINATLYVRINPSVVGLQNDLQATLTAQSDYVSDVTRSIAGSVTPTLSVDPISITGMVDYEERTFTVSGTRLSAYNVTVTPPSGFEIKKGSDSWSSSAINVLGTSVNSGVTFSVRMSGIGNYSESISVTTTATDGSLSKTISVSGNVADTWPNAVLSEPLGYAANDINSPDDLAWFAKQGGGNGTITADINMAAHPWVPIANNTGTFNGNGHKITDLTNMKNGEVITDAGMFASITSDTVKDIIFENCEFETSGADNYYGIIANQMDGGTVSGCVVGVCSLTGLGNRGCVVGQLSDGTVHSCISQLEFPMVHTITGGTLCNSLAVPISSLYTQKTSGTVQNCIYMNSNWMYVKSDGSEEEITIEGFNYGKKGCVHNGSTERLVDVLNKYAKDHSYTLWAQPLTTGINEGVPVLKMEGNNTVVGQQQLAYGNLSDFLSSGIPILFYGKGTLGTAYNGNNLYIDEDAALKVTANVDVKAHTSRFIANLPSREEREVWHHYASPVTGQSLGINYTTNDQCTWNQSCGPKLVGTGGFFPYLAGTDGNGWDLYCFHEPAYHWINFKRNSDSHWYSENHTANIAYTNETEFTPGKGYLVALASSSYVQATGNLNHGSFIVPVMVSDLSATPGAKLQGVNLLGNPYQSYLSFQAFADGNSGLWNGSAATYLTYDPEGDYYTQGSTAIASRGSQASSGNLSMHQGFFIVSDKPVGNYTATFTDAMCSVNPEGDVHFRGVKYAYPLVNLMVRDSEGVGDLAVVEFDRPEFAAAPKLFNYGGKGKVYFSYENEDDALLFLSEAIDQLPVHFDALEDGDYTLNWSTANADFSYLHLIDNITGADIDMLARNSYSFSATTRDYKSRFKMKFAYTGIGENEDTELVEVFAFLHDGNLIVNGQGTIDIIDMNGRTICNQKLTGEQNTVGLPNVAPGIYVVRLVNNSETKVQKIIVNK